MVMSKKISSHISKKVADKLKDIFKESRKELEEKWDDLKIFIQYGMLSDEKFYDRSKDFFLLKNVDGKYFTSVEYETLVKENQTDKDKNLIYLYTNNKEEQFSFVEAAKDKGYDVLVMDDVLSTALINKTSTTKFVRVDSDVVENLIKKSDDGKVELTFEQKEEISPIFPGSMPYRKQSFVHC